MLGQWAMFVIIRARQLVLAHPYCHHARTVHLAFLGSFIIGIISIGNRRDETHGCTLHSQHCHTLARQGSILHVPPCNILSFLLFSIVQLNCQGLRQSSSLGSSCTRHSSHVVVVLLLSASARTHPCSQQAARIRSS